MADAAEMERIIALRREGRTQKEIGQEIGKSRSYVQKRLAQYREVSVRPTNPQPPRVSKHWARSAAIPWARADGSSIKDAIGKVMELPDNQGEWTSFGLDRNTWESLGKDMTLPVLSNISPGISRAIWDYLRMLDPGHEVKVYRPGTETPDERAEQVLQQFIRERVEPRFTSLKGMFQQMFMGALYRGAFCAQLVTDGGRTPLEILIPDPYVIQFQATDDPDAGVVWTPGIVIDGNWQSVESEFFYYVAIDPLPGQPYGRSMIAPAAFPSIFILGMLYDLRRVVAQQGYPRTSLKVIVSKLREHYPDIEQADFQSLVDQVVEQVAHGYSTVNPDDAYVHTDAVEVQDPKGAIDTGVMGGAVQLIDKLQLMEVQAVKSMPLLMGITDGVSEANANRQWEIAAQGVKSLQHYAETVASRLFEMALRIQGIQATVKVQFAELRSAELLRDETTAEVRLRNAAFAEDRGWMDPDEASQYAVGHARPEVDEEADEEADEPQETEPLPDEDDAEEPIDEEEGATVEEDEGGGEGAGQETSVGAPAYVRGRVDVRVRRVTRRTVDAAVQQWEREMGGTAEATILSAVRVETAEDANLLGEDDWFWIEDTREFLHRSGDRLDTLECRDILDRFVARSQRELQRIISSAGEPTAWSADIRDLFDEAWQVVEPVLVAGMVFGRGGVSGMTTQAYEDTSLMVTEQQRYWQDFEDEVVALGSGRSVRMGDPEMRLTIDDGWGRISAMLDERMGWYMESSPSLYERGRSREWRVDMPVVPPLHPHCKCRAVYGRDENGPWGSWRTEGGACPECESMAAELERVRT